MKKAISILFLLMAFGSISWSQSDKDLITKRIGEYFNATENKDWETVINLIYPKLFQYIPKENMAQVFADLESEGMGMEMKDFAVADISNTIEADSEKFALIHYNVSMTIRFTSQEYREASVQASLKDSFEKSYGLGNVSHHPEDFSFDIQAARSMFAVATVGSADWFFMENDPSQEALTGMLIPESVRNHLAALDKRN